MNARKSIYLNMITAGMAGALMAALSLNAGAQSTATLEARAPLHATLMPAVKVTASISNPSDTPRWSVGSERPLGVTLMPTLTITADANALAMTDEPSQPRPLSSQTDEARSLVVVPANQALSAPTQARDPASFSDS